MPLPPALFGGRTGVADGAGAVCIYRPVWGGVPNTTTPARLPATAVVPQMGVLDPEVARQRAAITHLDTAARHECRVNREAADLVLARIEAGRK